MSDQHEAQETNAEYSAALSPLGGGGGGDAAYSFGYLDAGRTLEVNPAVAIHVDSDSDDDDKKKKKHKTKQPETPVKLAAIPIDVATGEPKAEGAIEVGKWSTGLCNCFDFCVPNCCMVTFCPCISAAQIATRLGFKYQTALAAFGGLVAVEYILYCVMFATIHTTELEVDYYYGYYYSYSSNRLSIWGYFAFLISVVLFIAYWQLRTKVRERFQLPGSCVEDFFFTFCCSCCALAQMATHVKSYKPHHCDFGAPDELPAYDE